MWFYRFACAVVDLLTQIISKRIVVGRENVPAEGAVIMIANHLSLVDPPLLGSVFPRPVHFMAKEELFHTPVVSWIVKNYLAFPVRRGEADRQALQTTLRYLRNGEVVGIFPEGTRSHDARLHPAHPGAALIAARAGAQVVPVAVTGTHKIFAWPRNYLRPEVKVIIGRPFVLSADGQATRGEALDKLTTRMMNALAELLPDEYRGVYQDSGDKAMTLR